ncbi:homoloc-13 [Holotrichia oblita]|uniref:Homoloc-13 n=1 Tax=Holotrichia oblita TaxID=644536 RepID=A0ACB9T789_HOLOL|nr:homoloc-13 [Holotrichia oblita]
MEYLSKPLSYSSNKDTSENSHVLSKKSYCENRGLTWSPTNKRPHKLKDRLRELEEYLYQNKIICFSWRDSCLSILLSKGIVININYNSKACDIISICFDKYLTSKIQNEYICDGVIHGSHIICICTDGRVFGYGGTWKDGWSIEGGPRRYIHLQGEYLAVWGRSGAEHPQPWSPLTKDHQRANLHLYWIGLRGPDLLSYRKTSAEPITVVISKIYSKNLIVVEQKVSQRGAVSVEVNVLELISNNLKRASVTAVPLQTQVCCSVLSENEIFLLLCCIDGTVALLDRNRGSTKVVKASFIPTLATWHESNCIAAIANERGQLQYLDTALNFLKSQISGEDCTPNIIIDISSYFTVQPTIVFIQWGPKDLAIALDHGPITIITHNQNSLNFLSLIQRYLNDGKADKAVNLLLSWEFNDECFSGLQRIVTYLMRLPLTQENARLLQNALGSFYSPPVPLYVEAMHNFGFQVKCLTRRFFHQLVRSSMFETAFLLAVDIGHHDLFMDLHYIAVKLGETEMAAAARAQASTLLSSECSRSSCSQCSETSSSSEEDLSNSEQHNQQSRNSSSYNDNYLTTNFNNAQPKTYSTYIPPIPNIDLPKVNFNKAVINKTPQLPPYTRQPPSNVPPLPVTTPPLPVTPVFTNISQSMIQYSQTNTYQAPSFITSTPPLTYSNQSRTYANFNNFRSIGNTYNGNQLQLSDIKAKPTIPPPLPVQNHPIFVTSTSNNPPTFNNPMSSLNSSDFSTSNSVSTSTTNSLSSPSSSSSSQTPTSAKKGQAKVKFSDTVTAFIVPEIKRPARPSLPAHVMDPQKNWQIVCRFVILMKIISKILRLSNVMRRKKRLQRRRLKLCILELYDHFFFSVKSYYIKCTESLV